MSALANLPSDLNRERLLGTEQTAEFLGISIPHFRRLYRAKKVPSGSKSAIANMGGGLAP
jgi:hypothetical protein